jgi:N-acetylmuramoyl-L-alanine amidase
MKHPSIAALLAVLWLAGPAPASAAGTAREMYTRTLAQERTVRDAAAKPTLEQMRRVVTQYEGVVRKYPASGYSDNALWQAANLALLAFERFGNEADRKTASRLFALLAKEYPASSLASQATAAIAALPAPASILVPPAAPIVSTPLAPVPIQTPATHTAAPPASGIALLRDVKRTSLPDGIRLIVEIESEVSYHQEEIANPRRLFFDLKNVRTASNLQDVSLKFDDDAVKEVRLGKRPQNTTRLVVDLQGVAGYTVYPLYGPYRLVIDLRRASASPAAPATAPAVPPSEIPQPAFSPAPAPPTLITVSPAKTAAPRPPALVPPVPEAKASAPVATLPKALPPSIPDSNSNGKFSLSRQLGLSVSRVVIDAGHGGHDPGAHGYGVTESELTLDVALRLQKLLTAQPGIEVVMTRDTDVFIPLEERTAIANREGADLFLSIHANASRNPVARGIETYFLNFAMNPEAEAVAARENATSSQSMHNLPDIVKAIALNNKLNESRDLAVTVQKSMAKRLSTKNRSLKDLGVKQAPFVVLIGAVMPSVLAEISFVTNKQDSSLLKTGNYRQQIAQSLFDGILQYQQSLKRLNSVAGKKATAQ